MRFHWELIAAFCAKVSARVKSVAVALQEEDMARRAFSFKASLTEPVKSLVLHLLKPTYLGLYSKFSP